MLRPALLAALLLATLAPAAAAAGPALCDYGICPIVRAEADPLRVCAGLGIGLQGVVVCGYERPTGQVCGLVLVGFHRYDTCDLLAIEIS